MPARTVTGPVDSPSARAALWLVLAGLSAACGRPAPGPGATRLVDVFDRKMVSGGDRDRDRAAPPDGVALRRAHGRPAGLEGRPGCRGPADPRRAPRRPHHDRLPDPAPRAHQRAWTTPTSSTAVEVRLRVSEGANAGARPAQHADGRPETEPARGRSVPWPFDERRSWPARRRRRTRSRPRLPSPAPASATCCSGRPTPPGPTFAIESVRLVFRREHLAGVPSGVSWQGLRDVFRETLVTRSPETVRFAVTLPSRPLLDLSVGHAGGRRRSRSGSRCERGGKESAVLTRTVTTPYRWERRSVDLGAFAGEAVTLAALGDRGPGRAPSRSGARRRCASARDGRERRAAADRDPRPGRHAAAGPPRRLRLRARDRADAAAPRARRARSSDNAITPDRLDEGATPSILTSLYPSTHGVHKIPDRLPSSATTIAEVYRAGAGTRPRRSRRCVFTGAVHQPAPGLRGAARGRSRRWAAPGPRAPRRARVRGPARGLAGRPPRRPVVRVPALLRPALSLRAEPALRHHVGRSRRGARSTCASRRSLKKFIASPFMAQRGMATREELSKAGLDPDGFLRYSKDWYDGSIRGMDREIGAARRAPARSCGLRDRTLIAFYADHGEEFHEHGRMFHGQSVYGEMIRVPLIFWGPGRVGEGRQGGGDGAAHRRDADAARAERARSRPPRDAGPEPAAAAGAGGGVGTLGARRPAIAEKQPHRRGTDVPRGRRVVRDRGRQLEARSTTSCAARQARVRAVRLLRGPARPEERRGLRAPGRGRAPGARCSRPGSALRHRRRLKPDGEAAKGHDRRAARAAARLGYVK